MVRPPAALVNNLAMRPSTAATTGVPRGAWMSSASCRRLPPPRSSSKVDRSDDASTPATGTIGPVSPPGTSVRRSLARATSSPASPEAATPEFDSRAAPDACRASSVTVRASDDRAAVVSCPPALTPGGAGSTSLPSKYAPAHHNASITARVSHGATVSSRRKDRRRFFIAERLSFPASPTPRCASRPNWSTECSRATGCGQRARARACRECRSVPC